MCSYEYSYNYDMASMPMGYWFICLIFEVFMIVCMWKMFEKAGEPGWAAIVPLYNAYVMFKIAWGNGWKFLLLLIPIANIVFAIMLPFKLAKAFGKSSGFGAGLLFLSVVFYPILAFDNSIKYVGAEK